MATIDNYASNDLIEAEEYLNFKNKVLKEYNRRQKGLGNSSVAALSALSTSNPSQNTEINITNGANPINILTLIDSPDKARQYAINHTVDYHQYDYIPPLSNFFTIVNNLIQADETTERGGCNAACTGLCINACKGTSGTYPSGSANYSTSSSIGKVITDCTQGCFSSSAAPDENCRTGCSSACITGCHGCAGICTAGCSGGCKNGCYTACTGDCNDNCYGACRSNCGSGCAAGCGATCSNACQFSNSY